MGAAVMLGVAALVVAGCVSVVRPPAGVRAPVRVFVVDYGYHSALFLPREGADGGGLREYAFGEWEWFALERDALVRAPGALLAPSRGALGRRDWSGDEPPLREGVHALEVERERAAALAARLDAEFVARAAERHEARGMEFVPSAERYSMARHCNTATVEWLRELGAQVSRATLVARFEVRQPPPNEQPPPRAE